MRTVRISFKILGIVWAAVFIIIASQIYFMFQNIFLTIIFLILSYAMVHLSKKFSQSLNKKSFFWNTIFLLIVLLHLLPLFLQFIGYKQPGTDNLLSAIIALILAYQKNVS